MAREPQHTSAVGRASAVLQQLAEGEGEVEEEAEGEEEGKVEAVASGGAAAVPAEASVASGDGAAAQAASAASGDGAAAQAVLEVADLKAGLDGYIYGDDGHVQRRRAHVDVAPARGLRELSSSWEDVDVVDMDKMRIASLALPAVVSFMILPIAQVTD